MNRFLAIPLSFSFLLFVAVVCSKSTVGKSPTSYFGGNQLETGSLQQDPESSELLSLEEIRTHVLEGFPTVGRYQWGSRAMPHVSTYAELRVAKGRQELDDTPFLLTSLIVVNENDHDRFPLFVDRTSSDVKIFVDEVWRPYEEWKQSYLPQYLETAKSGSERTKPSEPSERLSSGGRG